jgi:hypothetical protein
MVQESCAWFSDKPPAAQVPCTIIEQSGKSLSRISSGPSPEMLSVVQYQFNFFRHQAVEVVD